MWRLGHVAAVGARANSTVEMVGKLGVVFSDSCDRVADRPSYRDTSALRRGCGSSIATSQADRARQLAHKELALSVGLLFAPECH